MNQDQLSQTGEELEEALSDKSFSVTQGDVEVVIKGNQQISSLKKGGEEQEAIKAAVNRAIQQSQLLLGTVVAELTKE